MPSIVIVGSELVMSGSWMVEGLPSDELIVARTVAVGRGLADQFTTRHIMKKPLG